MVDLLKDWLHSRLGILVDFSPEIFGRHTRDGTVLAQIMHNYGIITSCQLSMIFPTEDPALSRVNLKTLRIWLKLINVTLSDEGLHNISQAKGEPALQLFYKVYLSLEGKDRLYFIALQKEREKSTPVSARFDVCKVCEEPPPYHPLEHELAYPLVKAADTILWHKNKFLPYTKAYKLQQERLKCLMEQPKMSIVPDIKIPDIREKEEREKLDEFARLHPVAKIKKKYDVIECCPDKKLLRMPSIKDPAAAAEYVKCLKKRKGKAAKSRELKLKSQTTMMSNAWDQLLKKQDRSFDEALSRRVLDQSRYEKRMMRKLCEVWDLKEGIVQNRRIIDAMLLKVIEKEHRISQDRHQEIKQEEIEDVEMETARMRELRQRIRDEKMRRLREQHRGICIEILRDLADIAVKISQYRQANDSQIPSFIWSECRTLFLKSQPIFNDEFEIKDEEEIESVVTSTASNDETRTEISKTEVIDVKEQEKMYRMKLEHQRALADTDFENYRDLAAPWNEYVPEVEVDSTVEQVSRLGCLVLGYIVHRLLEVLYPLPIQVTTCPVPRVKVAVIVQGVTTPALHEQLRNLLEDSGIRLVRMEDAINHCLESYKREMTPMEYIDLDVISAKEVRKVETKRKMDEPRERRMRRVERTLTPDTVAEKETQTPRQIPYDDMDPILSDTAYTGKLTYEFLMLGQPISNELNTKILIEYLKAIGDVEGWVLVNYPNTYEQMALLEKTLTGHEIPVDQKFVSFADVNIEDIDPPSPRITFEYDDADVLAICRQSRLLPNPISRKDPRSIATFMTMYIKAMSKPKVLQEYPCAPIPADATWMDEFYVNESIAYGFFYGMLNPATLKQLAGLIAGELPTKEPFDEKVPQTTREKKTPRIDLETAVIKRLVSKSKWERSHCEEEMEEEEKEEEEEQEEQEFEEIEPEPVDGDVKPGENDWQWLDLPQSPALLQVLGALWESIEEAYVENLKELFCLKRMHASAIVPYKDLVLRNLTQFVERPDNRQILLQDFHRAFNDINEDLRDDLDAKCELHCRVNDFRTELWELCDVRRHQAEGERKRTLQNQWIPVEAAILVNVYIGIMQVELDRFTDTMQLLQDYYTSMSQKPLQESRLFSKVILEHIELEDLWETTPLDTENEQPARSQARVQNESVKILENFKIEIEDLLIDTSKIFDPDESSVYNLVKDNVESTRRVVDNISSMVLETLRKEEKAVPSKVELKSATTKPDSPDSVLTKRSHDLIEEWRYAVSYEIDRVRRRLDVLDAASRSDIIFLLDTMKHAYHRIYGHIVERYQREIESINEMTNVFCFAIEEEKAIQQELLFDGDRFVARPHILMYHEDPKRVAIREPDLPLRFRMVQLGRLADIFRRIAPQGNINERALIYVLQDLVSCDEEDCYPSSVPCGWRQLRVTDIERLIRELFGTIEHIEWREFIVYAMDLPMPTHRDILKSRLTFGMHDFDLRETITYDQFRSVPLWFVWSEHKTVRKDMEALLVEDLDYDEIMAMMMQEEEQLGDRGDSKSRRDLIETDSLDNIALRLLLAKELLCRLYQINRNTVHYTAMLLAFCKNEDPREGLGKAFTLAMGVRVCTNVQEGEEYVAKEKALKEHSPEYLRQLAYEAVEYVLSHLLRNVERNIYIFEKLRAPIIGKRQLRIHELDTLMEIDPTTLLPQEDVPRHLLIEDEEEYEVVEDFWPEEIIEEEEVTFWLPFNVCITVLSACLPMLDSRAEELLQPSLTLNEAIKRVYDDVRDDELSHFELDTVLAYRVVNHSFIRKLLASTNKFLAKNMTDILRSILIDRNNATLE